jgi:metal-dependent hydrolase (beta-lactamase superfamily II)
LKNFEKKEFKNAPTLALLLEIETRIEQADAYILHNMATNEETFDKEMKAVKVDMKAVKTI